MRTLLVRPPIYSKTLEYPSGPRFGLPLSLLYLAAYLEKQHRQVAIYDALVDFEWKDVARDQEGNYHIGAAWPKLLEKILAHEPDIVGITNPFSDMADYTIRVAAEIKAARPGVMTVVGGPHATSCPQSFLSRDDSVDYVVRGEGELTLARLVEARSRGQDGHDIPGMTFEDADGIHSNPAAPFIENLDDLPLPAYHLAPMERYFDLVRDGYPSRFMFEYPGSEREVSIITSRGCPFHCVFCGNHIHMGRRWRHHSVSYVIRHMELLVSRYGVRHFHLEDDNIALNIGRFDEILDAIKAKGWDITWDTSNGIRLEGLTPELLRKIKQTGCTYLEFGIDSGKQETLDRIIKKGVKLEEAEHIVATCKRLGIDVHALYVVGFPGEDRQGVEETFAFAKRLLRRYDAIPHLCLARPLPGTELYDICERGGYLTEPILPEMGSGLRGEVYPRVMIRTEQFTPQDLERWVAGFGPDLVGMTAMTHEICRAADIAKRLKRDLSVPVVVGGCQVTALPRRTLSEFPSFDYGINGEGERALLALAQRLSSGSADVHDIESLVFREGNEITINARPPFLTSEDLDGLPFPSFDDYYGDDRQALKARDACCVLTTSRGCPYNCAFCMQVLGRKVRRRSPENIIREMERAINRWGAHTFDFYDDILLYDGPETRRLLEIMIEKGFPRTVRWCGVTRANLVNPDLMALARKAGCFRLGLGVESGDDEILKIIGKGITVDQVRKAVRIIKDAGIAVDAYFILGHPNETEEQVKKTVDLAAELNPDTIAVGLMVPYPGTRINEMALRGAGGYRLLSEDWSQYDKYGGKTLELSGLPYHKLIRWQRRALINLYLRNLRPLGLIRYLWRRRSALSFFMKRRLGIRIVSRE